MLKADLLKRAKRMYPHYTYLYKMKKSELEALLDQECSNSKKNTFRKWKNNSCYMDSLLFILSALVKTDLIDLDKIKIATGQTKKAVQEMRKHLKTYDVPEIRSLLQNFKSGMGIDWIHDQQEPMDLWRVLEEFFVMFKTKILTQVFDPANTLKSENTQVFQTAIQEVMLSDLDSKNKKLRLKSVQTSSPSRKEVSTIVKAKMLIFHINRRADYTSNKKLVDRVDPPMRMRPKENTKSLYLRAIIVHHGSTGESGHYTTVFDCEGVWWEYDDMKSVIKRVGLTLPDYILKNSSDYFYW